MLIYCLAIPDPTVNIIKRPSDAEEHKVPFGDKILVRFASAPNNWVWTSNIGTSYAIALVSNHAVRLSHFELNPAPQNPPFPGGFVVSEHEGYHDRNVEAFKYPREEYVNTFFPAGGYAGKIFAVMPRDPETKLPNEWLLSSTLTLSGTLRLPLKICCFHVPRLEEPRPRGYATFEIHHIPGGEFPEVYFNGEKLSQDLDEFIHKEPE